MNNKTKWQHFHHVADIGIRGFGETPEQAFVQAAIAMTAVITEPQSVAVNACIDIECEAMDLEYLFVDWLNALVYEMATRNMLFSQFDVSIADGHLKARVCGETVNREKHQPAVEVKGATLTELQVREQKDGGWLAQCIVDV
jgi:tRNA nucleotidyltransferase (CCA-adding enzyme)